MTRKEVKQIKYQILNEISELKTKPEYAINLQCSEGNLYKQSAQKRLSVGYSVKDNEKYMLELMAYEKNGSAHNIALNIKRKLGEENVNIQIFNSGEIPNGDSGLSPFHFGHKQELHIGLSISHKNGHCGTLGCFLRNRNNDENDYILSCNHVMASLGKASINKNEEAENYIFHPGYNDAGKKLKASMRIAKLNDFAELYYDRTNVSDSAIAMLVNDRIHCGNIIPVGYELPYEGEKIYLFEDKEDDDGLLNLINSPIYKIGKTTGFTEGSIGSMNMDRIWLKVPDGKTMVFDNVIQINWGKDDFSKNGDSGSLAFVKVEDKFYAIGLVFASGEVITGDGLKQKVSFVCNIKDIMAQYPQLEYVQ